MKASKEYQEYLLNQVQGLSERDSAREISMSKLHVELDIMRADANEVSSLRSRSLELQSTIASLSKQIESLLSESAELKAVNDSLTLELQSSQNDFLSMQEELTTNLVSVQAAKDTAEEKCKELSINLTAAEQCIATLGAQAVSSEDNLKSLRDELKVSQEELARVMDDYQWSKQQADDQISCLQCQVD